MIQLSAAPTSLQANQAPWSQMQSAANSLGQSQPGVAHVDGVRWDIGEGPDGQLIEQGDFRDTFIPTNAVQDVYLAIKPFTDKPGNYPGHAQLHFEFPADAPIRDSQGNEDRGLVLSVEVRFKQGSEMYEPGSQTPILYQLCTWSDAIEKSVGYHRYPLQLYKLQLSQEQKVQLLEERLAAATGDHTQDIYDPVTNSCLSTLIDGVNKVLPTEQQIPHSNANAKIPVWCPKVFKKYNVTQSMEPNVSYEVPAGLGLGHAPPSHCSEGSLVNQRLN